MSVTRLQRWPKPIDRQQANPGELRQDGPTLEEFVAAGYPAEAYPPKGYAERESPGLTAYRATPEAPEAPASSEAPAPAADPSAPAAEASGDPSARPTE